MKSRILKGLAIALFALALYALGVTYRFKKLDRATSSLKTADYQTALNDLRPLASLGDHDAQYIIAQMYACGWGVEKDAAAAFQWLSRADAKRATGEAYVIAKNFADGAPETKPDQSEAVKWFRIAAENGSREAAKILSDA